MFKVKTIKKFVSFPILATDGSSTTTISPQIDYRSLMMCSADPKSCPVHTITENHVRWSFIYTEEDLTALIASLNPLGKRERELRDQLDDEKELILDHISHCKVRKLTVPAEERLRHLEALVKNTISKKYLHLLNPLEAAIEIVDPNTDLDIRMRQMMVDLADKVRTGCLGVIKVKDKQKWRDGLVSGNFETQVEKLVYGFQKLTPTDLESGSDDDIDPDDDLNMALNQFEDPGHFLGDTVEIESEDSSDEGISLHDSVDLQRLIHQFAQAMIQVKQSIEDKFMGPPFVPKFTKNQKNNKLLKKFTANFEIALMGTVNFSQLFLHFNILNDAIKWSKSVLKAYCRICRRRNEPDKMLLCDNCNGGHHMHCLKPKLKSVPANDWFCPKCDPEQKVEKPQKRARKRKFFSEDSDEEENVEETEQENVDDEEGDEAAADEQEEDDDADEAEEDDDDEDEADDVSTNSDDDVPVCSICTFSAEADELATCTTCTLICHFDCAIPPLRKNPRNWICWRCQKKQKRKARTVKTRAFDDDEVRGRPKKNKKESSGVRLSNGRDSTSRRSSRKHTINDDVFDNDSDDEPLIGSKRPRTSDEGGGSSSTTSTGEQTHAKIRRSRNGDLPLHSVDLYALLDDIAKNDDSWPFNRPVSKMEVPDYYKIIKSPMDFAKIKSRLNLGHYQTDYDIMNDIQQVFVNCDLYNTSESEIYQ